MKIRFHALDGLRGVCALLVLCYHAFEKPFPSRFFAHGYLSVDLFFVISGFVIAASYEGRFASGMSLRAFLAARMRRLAPVYWIGTALCAFAVCVLAGIGAWDHDGAFIALTVLASVFLVPLLGSSGAAFAENPPAWTLFTEFVVNIYYGAFARRLTNRILFAIILVSWAGAEASAIMTGHGFYYGWHGTDILLALFRGTAGFALGVLIHRGYASGMLARLPSVSPVILIGFWIALSCVPGGGANLLFDSILVMLCQPLLVILLVAGTNDCPKWFTVVGALSYPLYASHFAVVTMARNFPSFQALGPRENILLAAGTIVAATGIAFVVQIWIEPFARRVFAVAPAGSGGTPFTPTRPGRG